MLLKKYKQELLTAVILFSVIVITIIYGGALSNSGISIRQWNWSNLLLILPLLPLLFVQQKASLPSLQSINEKKNGWISSFGAGMIFGLLDVLIIKFILHPEPYTELPPFLQPFPYSTFLYTSGAIEIELYYRMIPLTIFLFLNTFLLKGRGRNVLIIVLAVLTSIIEPIQQFPDGAWWFIIYATLSGIAMNAWQFRSYLKYGFVASLAVRLGHYLLWHVLLGVYVEYFELV